MLFATLAAATERVTTGDHGPEPVEFVAPVAGTYRFDVRSLEKNAKPGNEVDVDPGDITLTDGELRANLPADDRLLGCR